MTVRRSFPLSFIPLVPYPPLRGTFPSRGRLTIRGYRHLKCGETATRALSPSYQSMHSSFLPPSFERRCPEGAEVGSYREMKAGIGFTELLPAEQPLREGARQRRRMDPRGGLKTNVKLSIPHACHSERNEKTLSFAVRDSRFSHMCRAPLRFPHLSFLPLLSYPPLWGTFL